MEIIIKDDDGSFHSFKVKKGKEQVTRTFLSANANKLIKMGDTLIEWPGGY